MLTNEEIATHKDVSSSVLLNERGGQWLAVMRHHIQSNATNGAIAAYGSKEILRLRGHTVHDLEMLASAIAAAAVNEARGDIARYFRRMRSVGLGRAEGMGVDPVVVTKVARNEDGSLDHSHCVGAHSWIAGCLVFGQGTFSASGAWEHPCAECASTEHNPTAA